MRKCYTHIHWVYITHIYWVINDIKHLLPKEISFDDMKMLPLGASQSVSRKILQRETSAVTAVFNVERVYSTGVFNTGEC